MMPQGREDESVSAKICRFNGVGKKGCIRMNVGLRIDGFELC